MFVVGTMSASASVNYDLTVHNDQSMDLFLGQVQPSIISGYSTCIAHWNDSNLPANGVAIFTVSCSQDIPFNAINLTYYTKMTHSVNNGFCYGFFSGNVMFSGSETTVNISDFNQSGGVCDSNSFPPYISSNP